MNIIKLKSTIVYMVLLGTFALAGKLEVTADSFSSKESEGKAYFIGNASAKKDGSDIKANQVVVSFDINKTIIKYEADGNTTFTIKKGKMLIKGSCDTVSYSPTKDVYALKGDVVVHDTIKKRTLYGEDIIIDNNKSYFRVVGKKDKPAKIIFEVK